MEFGSLDRREVIITILSHVHRVDTFYNQYEIDRIDLSSHQHSCDLKRSPVFGFHVDAMENKFELELKR